MPQVKNLEETKATTCTITILCSAGVGGVSKNMLRHKAVNSLRLNTLARWNALQTICWFEHKEPLENANVV